jgi:hypothetical protein
MCHEPDARAPLPPISGASDVARSADIVLRSSDGTEFAAFEALTPHDHAPGIVIYRTSGVCIPSTATWRCGRPRRGCTRSRSTTSGGPRG